MKYLNTICLILLLALVHTMQTPAVAQSQEQRIVHSIESAYPEQTRTHTVHLPASYHTQTDFDYPVLYLLDGESNLDFSVAVAAYLAENALIPEMIVVGLHAGATRNRDYLPATGNPLSGEADVFLDYLEKELIPAVDANYRTAPLRLLSGHSMGGVLVTYTMINRANLFQGYLTQSPYLEASLGDPLLEALEKTLASEQNLDTYFYANLGDEPNLEPHYGRMESILTNASSNAFKWSSRRAHGKTHMTTRLVGQYDALEDFFEEDWPLDTAQLSTDGFEVLENHLARLSEKYGYSVLYSEQLFQQSTQQFLTAQNLPAATKSAELYVSQYQASPLAHFLLGVSLASGGKRDAALMSINTAISLYEHNPEPSLQPVYHQMKQIQVQLGGG